MQWGFLSVDTDNITFPISFKNTDYVFLSKIYGPASGGSDLVAYNYFQRLQTGVTYDYSYTRNWIAIGCSGVITYQQLEMVLFMIY